MSSSCFLRVRVMLHKLTTSRCCLPRRRIQNFARTTVAKKEVTRRRAHKEATIVKNRNEAAMQIQCFTRVQAAKLEASERRKRKESAVSTEAPTFPLAGHFLVICCLLSRSSCTVYLPVHNAAWSYPAQHKDTSDLTWIRHKRFDRDQCLA